MSGTLSDGEYEEFLRWTINTELLEAAEQSGHYRLSDAASATATREESNSKGD